MVGRSVPEWVAKHPDQAIPKRVKLRVWERCGGRCARTGRKLQVGEPYDFDHILALANGGEHREGNLQIISREAHREKTREDVKTKAKVDRIRARHLGLSKTKSRGITAWRKFDGTPVYKGECAMSRCTPANRFADCKYLKSGGRWNSCHEPGGCLTSDKEDHMTARRQPSLSPKSGTREAEPSAADECAAREALRGLTKVQRMYVKDGSAHGDIAMRTVAALLRKGLFYIKIDSPNGLYGSARLTPLGEAVQAALPASAGSPWLRGLHDAPPTEAARERALASEHSTAAGSEAEGEAPGGTLK